MKKKEGRWEQIREILGKEIKTPCAFIPVTKVLLYTVSSEVFIMKKEEKRTQRKGTQIVQSDAKVDTNPYATQPRIMLNYWGMTRLERW